MRKEQIASKENVIFRAKEEKIVDSDRIVPNDPLHALKA